MGLGMRTGRMGDRGREYIDRQMELGAFVGLCKNLVQWKVPGIYKGGFREVMEDTEPELAFFCNQAKLHLLGLGHHSSHRTFYLQFVQPKRCTGIKVAQHLW